MSRSSRIAMPKGLEFVILAVIVAGCWLSPIAASPTVSPLAAGSAPPATTSSPTSLWTASPAAPPSQASPSAVASPRAVHVWAKARSPVASSGSGLVRWLAGRYVLFGDRGIVLSSPDGVSWSPLPDLPGGADGAVVTDVVAFASGFVAVGWTPDGSATMAVVWTSRDGVTWQRLDGRAAFRPGMMSAVTAGPHGLVAVGAVARSCTRRGEVILVASCGGRAVVWRSPDGRTWSRIPDSPIFDLAIIAVAAGEFGYVATGGGNDDACLTCGTVGPPLWYSADGKTWRLEDPRNVTPAGPGAGLAIAGVDGRRVVAVGVDGPHFVAWSSTDGRSWFSRVVDDVREQGAAAAAALAPVPGRGIVAVLDGGVWTSPDGLNWTNAGSLEPDPAVAIADGVACGPDSCVVTGWLGAGGGRVLWRGTAALAP